MNTREWGTEMNKKDWIKNRVGEIMRIGCHEDEAYFLARMDYQEAIDTHPLYQSDKTDSEGIAARMALKGWLLGFQRLAGV